MRQTGDSLVRSVPRDFVRGLLANHWQELPDWPPDRELWACYLTLSGQSDVYRCVRHYQRHLEPLRQLDMVALPALHITLQGMRFVDEARADHISLLADALRSQLLDLELPTLTTLPPVTDTDAVQLPVVPRVPLVRLRDAIQATIRSELGDEYLYKLPEPKDGFDPHITVAYANTEIHNEHVFAALRGAADVRAEFRVEHLSLLKLRRGRRNWSWGDERAMPIGTPAMRSLKS